jgi:hypothetical protein
MIGLGAVGLVLLAIGLWRLVRGLTSGVPSRVAVAAAWLVWITQVWVLAAGVVLREGFGVVAVLRIHRMSPGL